jgi:hypothetical protein
MSGNIVKFPGHSKTRQEGASSDFTGCSTGYCYARRNRHNPLRQKLRKAEIAVVEVNKVQYQHSSKELEMIRAGVEAARMLAEELARAAEPILRVAPAARPIELDQTRADAVRQMVRKILEEEGLT